MRDPYKTLIIKYPCYQIISQEVHWCARQEVPSEFGTKLHWSFFLYKTFAEQQNTSKYCFPREKLNYDIDASQADILYIYIYL